MDAIYISSTQFSVSTDKTLEFVSGRRLKLDCGVDGVIYATVNTSSYSDPNTTITIKESELTSNLTTVLYGVVEPGVLGSLPDHSHDGSEGSGGSLTLGATTLSGLADTPSDYGVQGQYLQSTGSGTQWADPASTSTFLNLSDTPDSYETGKYLISTTSGIEFTNNADGLISEATTLYISVSGSDITGDGSLENPYASFTGPVEYLKDKQINPNTNIYIRYLDGSHTLTSSGINAQYLPHSDRIHVYGTTVLDRNITSVQSSSGSAGAYSVIYNVDDVSNISVGNYMLVSYNAANGTNPKYACGVHEITNVDVGNSRLTVLSKHQKGSPAGAVTASIKIFQTILNQYSTSSSIVCQYGKHIKLGGFVLVGGVSGNGIQALATGSIAVSSTTPIGVAGFYIGATVGGGGYAILDNSGFSGAHHINLLAQETSTLRATNGVVSGSDDIGVLSQISGNVSAANMVSTGNVGIGFYAIYTSTITASPSHSTGNVSYGWYATYNAMIQRLGTCTDANNSSATGTANSGYIQT